MNILSIASYLVHPGKNQEDPQEAQGTLLPLAGSIFRMLSNVFVRSDSECQIPIRFLHEQDGSQNNEVRKDLITFIDEPDLETGRALAHRLRDCTTNRSGLGLFFLILGTGDGESKIVLSRFPADQGILAEAHEGALQIEFIERVFMKSAASYKAALYRGSSYDSDFWSGSAVDKQLNVTMADYWIREFLKSDFKTTSKAGTKRFAVALRRATQVAPDIATKRELVAITALVQGFVGQAHSIQDLMAKFNLSDAARSSLISQLPHEGLVTDSFLLDQDEFQRHAPLASVELDSGGILLAPSDRFDEVFQSEIIDEAELEYRFISEGRIVDERIRGRR